MANTLALWYYNEADPAPNGDRIYTSTDGVNFSQTLGFSPNNSGATYGFHSAAYSGTAWIVCGRQGVWRSSDDGLTWTQVRTSSHTWVTYGKGRFFLSLEQTYSSAGSAAYLSDDDGLTWVSSDIPPMYTATQVARPHFTGDAFLVPNSATTLSRSTTGDNGSWSNVTHGLTDYSQLISDGAGTVVMLSLNYNSGDNKYHAQYVVSTDHGVTWSAPSSAGLPTACVVYAVAYGAGKFVMFGVEDTPQTNGPVFARYSSDGVVWSTPTGTSIVQASSANAALVYSAAGSKFIYVSSISGSSYPSLRLESTDGVAWSTWGGPAMDGIVGLFSGVGVSYFWTNFVNSYEA